MDGASQKPLPDVGDVTEASHSPNPAASWHPYAHVGDVTDAPHPPPPTNAAASWRFILLAFLISRLLILGLGYAYFYSFYPGEPPAPAVYEAGHGAMSWHPLTLLDLYDTTNYLEIAREGYTPRQAPFFPLWPLLLWLTGAQLVPGILLANLCFLGALRAIGQLWGRGAVIAACAAPAGLFFITAYTESLFLFVSATSLLAIRKERWGWAAFWGGLTALTRPVGWTLVGAYCVYALFKAKGRQKGWIGLALGLTALFPLYLWVQLGDPLAFLHAESTRFTRELRMPGWGIVSDLGHILRWEVPGEWTMMALFNGTGLLFLGLALRRFRGGLETDLFWLYTLFYTLMILATPITDFAYLPATHAVLRYACGCVTIYAVVGAHRIFLVAFVPLAVMTTLMMTLKWFIM